MKQFAIAIIITSITAVGCSKKVDSLPQTISLSTDASKADGFSIKTSNDFFAKPNQNDQSVSGFDGTIFSEKTGADTVVLFYAYGSKVSSTNFLPNVTDTEITDSYSNSGFTVTKIDRTPIPTCKTSIIVTYKKNKDNYVDVYLYTGNLSKSATITTANNSSSSNTPLSETQLTAVQNMYKSFRFINQ